MTIKPHDHMPNVDLHLATPEGPQQVNTLEFFANKTTVLFGLPGAFTPVCTMQQVPGYIKEAAALRQAGVDQIVCLSVNDPFVMQVWADSMSASGIIHMLCDGSVALTNALGLTADLSAHGLGIRSKRYAMVIVNNVVQQLQIEESLSNCQISSASSLLSLVQQSLQLPSV